MEHIVQFAIGIDDKAAHMLADRFPRTKKYREAMGAVIAKDGE